MPSSASVFHVDGPANFRSMAFIACASVVASDLPNGAALLDMRIGRYYSLNAVGAHVWKDLQAPASFQHLVLSILDKFDVDPESCSRDLSVLLGALVSAELVEVANVKTDEALG